MSFWGFNDGGVSGKVTEVINHPTRWPERNEGRLNINSVSATVQTLGRNGGIFFIKGLDAPRRKKGTIKRKLGPSTVVIWQIILTMKSENTSVLFTLPSAGLGTQYTFHKCLWNDWLRGKCMKSRLGTQKGGQKIDYHFRSFSESGLNQDTPSDEPHWTGHVEETCQMSSQAGKEYDTPLSLQEPSFHRLPEIPLKKCNGKKIYKVIVLKVKQTLRK